MYKATPKLGPFSTQWKSFITGSFAYGEPRQSDPDGGGPVDNPSDIDLVVLMSIEDLGDLVTRIAEEAYQSGFNGQTLTAWDTVSDRYGEMSTASLRFGPLNLIVTTNEADYKVWRDGTAHLKRLRAERGTPIDREEAVAYLSAKRKELEDRRNG